MRSGDIFNTNIEKIFSPIKIRIIYYLYSNEFSTLSSIIQHVGSNYKVISRHIHELREIGIIREYRLNKIRIFSLNETNEITLAILKLINILKTR